MAKNNQKSEEEEIHEKLSVLFTYMEQGFECRDSNLMENRVTICRGKDLVKFMGDNVEEVAKHILAIAKVDIGPKGKNYMQNFYDVFLKYKILTKIDRMPDDKKKFPKRLNFDRDPLVFEENKFYIITATRSQKKNYIWLAVAILVVLLACLFPVWPLSVKLGIWWVTFILLCSLIGLLLLRVLIYAFFFNFGLEFWIFPDLFSDRMGLIDCFKRPLLVERRDDCWRVIMIRIGFIGMIGSLAWIIYLNQETFWNVCQSIYQMFIDIIEFGNDKISNHHKGTSISIVNKHDNYMKNLLNEDLEE